MVDTVRVTQQFLEYVYVETQTDTVRVTSQFLEAIVEIKQPSGNEALRSNVLIIGS